MTRNAMLAEALQHQAGLKEKRKDAVEQRRAKLVKNQPWRVLAQEWREEVLRVFGKDFPVEPWTTADGVLARNLLREADLNTAIRLVHLFLRTAKSRGRAPAFKLFWAMRMAVRAEAEGMLQSRRQRIDRVDEYNPDTASRYPKVGW